MTVADALVILHGFGSYSEAYQDALKRVENEIARLEREVRQQDVLIQRWMTEAEDKQAEIARLQRHPDAWSQEAFDQQKARAEAAEAKNAKLSALIVEQEAEYRKERRAAEAEVSRWRDMCTLRRQRQKQAEAESARQKARADALEASLDQQIGVTDNFEARLNADAEEIEQLAAERGIPFALDHIGLDGMANEVVALHREIARLHGVIREADALLEEL